MTSPLRSFSLLRALGVGLIAAALVGVAYLLYWRERLGAVRDLPGVAVVAQPFSLPPPGPTRPVELGFVRLALPAALRGDVVENGNSALVALEPAAGGEPALVVGAPVTQAEVRGLLDAFGAVSGAPAPTYWALQTQVLRARAVSVWTVPWRGPRATRTRLALLALKAAELAGVTGAEWYEDERFGAIVLTGPALVTVELADKRAGVAQRFILQRGAADAHALVAALVRSYELATTNLSEAHVKALLAAAGVPRRLTATAVNPTVAFPSPAQLQQALAAVTPRLSR